MNQKTIGMKTIQQLDRSISTVVPNSRDWSEIVWLPKVSHFKINILIGFIQKNAGMHWLSYNDAAPWLNEVKT